MSEQNKVIAVVSGRASLDGVDMVESRSLPVVRVAVVQIGKEFHGIQIVQTVASEEWEDEYEVAVVDPAVATVSNKGLPTVDAAFTASRRWADQRVAQLLSEQFSGLEVQ